MTHHAELDDLLASRRSFLKQGTLLLAGLSAGGVRASEAWAAEGSAASAKLRLGVMTDIHYADRDPAGSRYYRESLGKLREAVTRFNAEKVDVTIELGDFIDAAKEVETELGYLRTIEAEYAKFQGQRHYVLGNHCVQTLTKAQFLEHTKMPAAHYSFDQGNFHFIILDACYRADGVSYNAGNFDWTDTFIAEEEVDWLKADLQQTQKPTIVAVHQRLDLDPQSKSGAHYAPKNAPEVRRILADSQKVLAVLMGHSHRNHYQQIDNIHYCVFRACVEGEGEANSGYAIADLFADGSIRLKGCRDQASYEWNRQA